MWHLIHFTINVSIHVKPKKRKNQKLPWLHILQPLMLLPMILITVSLINNFYSIFLNYSGENTQEGSYFHSSVLGTSSQLSQSPIHFALDIWNRGNKSCFFVVVENTVDTYMKWSCTWYTTVHTCNSIRTLTNY